ncbi:MAG: type II toxin-antitoxin system VapC family toxin [Balneolaceae bacterium]
MTTLFDSSALVALLVQDHPKYDYAVSTFERLIENKSDFYICAHSLSETYRTLTWGRGYLTFTANKAYEIIQKSVYPTFKIVDLNQEDYNRVLLRMKNEKLTGAIIYDGLISQAATKVNADYLVTFNAKDFQRVFPENGADLIIPG